MRGIRTTAGTLLNLVRSWLHVDQIRISPLEGRLLSLQPGQRVLLREHIYVVDGPNITSSANRREIIFRLHSDEGPAYLTIQRTMDGKMCGTQLLNHLGNQEDIFDDDIDLLPSEGSSPSMEPKTMCVWS